MTQTARDLRDLTLRSQNEIIDVALTFAETRISDAAKAGVFEVTVFHVNPVPRDVQYAVKESLVARGFDVTIHPAGSAQYSSGALVVNWLEGRAA